MKIRASTYWRLMPFLTKRQRGPLLMLIPLVLTGIIMQLLRPWPMKLVLDGLFFGYTSRFVPEWLTAPDRTTEYLIACCSAIVLFATIDAVATYFQVLISARAGQKAVQRIRAAVVDRIQSLDLQYHRKSGLGDLLMRTTGDVALLREILLTGVTEVARSLLVVVGMLLVMFLLDFRLTLTALAVLPPLVLAIRLITPSIRTAVKKQREKEGLLATDVSEALQAISVVQSYAIEDRASEKIRRQNRSSGRAGLTAKRLEASLGRTAEILLACGLAVILGLGALRALDGRLTPGDLVVFASYVRGFYKPLRNIANRTARLAKAGACAERIVEILDLEPEIQDLPGAVTAPVFRGELRLEQVEFGYEKNQPVLQGIDLSIKPGEFVALVGRSGAGKSTIAHLIPRLLEPDSGKVLIDGRDIREFTLESLRRQVGLVSQDTILLRGTILENLAIARPDAGEDELLQAAREAGADQFIRDLPDGYETMVGERGSTLSGGQARRIALARMLLKNPPVVVLDEPLVALDAELEQEVSQSLRRVLNGRTTLLIAHRFTLLPNADQILVIDQGRIVEQGRHAELIASDGLYRRLYEARDRKEQIPNLRNTVSELAS